MTEREKFEKWVEKNQPFPSGILASKHDSGEYFFHVAQVCWLAWQARAQSPHVPEGMALVPVKASAEITFEIRGEKIVFCKDGVYFALTKEQTTAMHAAMLAATKENGE